MSENGNEQKGGIIGSIQQLPQVARVAIFFIGVTLVIVGLFGLTGFLYLQQVRNIPRSEPVTMQEDSVMVEEFITFEDDDAYPGAIAVAPEGTLYTGSFATGTVWQATPDGTVTELSGTRDELGSISGLDVGADGTLYILDRRHPIESRGAQVYRLVDGNLERIAQFPAEGNNAVQSANDIAVDSEGRVYLVDLGGATIWRINPDAGTINRWWQPDTTNRSYALVGAAYYPARDSLLVTDASAGAIYTLSVADDSPQADALYNYTGDTQTPGFNGITTGTAGEVYVAALGTNRVARLNPDSGDLTYLAGAFRGSSDVAFDDARQRLYVNNWDQRSLLPVQVVFLEIDIEPRLPFSVDVLTFTESDSDEGGDSAESTPEASDATP
jgi:streptogramin lyase